MKSAMQRTMRAGCQGIKTSVSGRLGGADMARTEFYSEGTIPLQTLELTLIMDLLKPTQHMVRSVLRHGSIMAKFFQ